MRVASRLMFVAAAAVASSVLAVNRTWQGGSTAWGTAGNWSGSPSGVPGSSDLAIIPGSMTNYPVISAGDVTVGGLRMDPGSQLTLNAGNTLRVNAQTGSSWLNGTLNVSGANAILDLYTGQMDWTNGGTLEFGNGGNLKATYSTYHTLRTLTNNGTIQTDLDNPGSTIQVPFTTIVGGTLDGNWWARSSIGGERSGVFNLLSFTNVTLGSNFSAVSQALDIDYGRGPAALFLTDSVTNNSTVFNYPAYGTMKLAVSSGSTFTFGGSGSLGLQGQTLSGTGVSTIANNDTHTLQGYGTLGAANVTSAGTIKATGGTSGTPRTLSATALTSTGAIVVDQDNTLSVSGTLLSDTGSTVAMGGGTINAGTFTLKGALSGYGTIGDVANSGSILATGGTAGNSRTLNSGTITGSGTVTIDQYNSLSATGTVTASAVHVYGELHTDNADWTVDTLNNTGTVHVEMGRSLTSTGAITGEVGSIFGVFGTVTAPSVNVAGTIMGSGSVHSEVTLTGLISPGNSSGELTVDGLTIGDGAGYDYEAGDMVTVDGTLEFMPGANITVHVPLGTTSGFFMTADSVLGTPRFTLDGMEGYVYQEGTSFGFAVPEPGLLFLAGAVCLLSLARRPVSRRPI